MSGSLLTFITCERAGFTTKREEGKEDKTQRASVHHKDIPILEKKKSGFRDGLRLMCLCARWEKRPCEICSISNRVEKSSIRLLPDHSQQHFYPEGLVAVQQGQAIELFF